VQGPGIVMQAWYPLGGRGYTAELSGNEEYKKAFPSVLFTNVIVCYNLLQE